ncbi:CASP-like protein 4U1 isoform X1 [Iris pallida]|uniref:CASP-like protein 4U1 isoform X1 n=1 Tax=Iris pallida TaxID=29817 RepID=A0AAX6G867_IRIPA|nr:CASP-like protein 4U1 isoform X1 [Iris pallida]
MAWAHRSRSRWLSAGNCRCPAIGSRGRSAQEQLWRRPPRRWSSGPLVDGLPEVGRAWRTVRRRGDRRRLATPLGRRMLLTADDVEHDEGCWLKDVADPEEVTAIVGVWPLVVRQYRCWRSAGPIGSPADTHVRVRVFALFLLVFVVVVRRCFNGGDGVVIYWTRSW